jgi:hypothetical protein
MLMMPCFQMLSHRKLRVIIIDLPLSNFFVLFLYLVWICIFLGVDFGGGSWWCFGMEFSGVQVHNLKKLNFLPRP